MLEFVFVIFVACLISAVLGYHIGRARSSVKSYPISNDQLNSWVRQFYNDKDYSKLDFTEFISDWLRGNVPPQEMSNSGQVQVEGPCLGSKCSCHPTREDHCSCMNKNGRCIYSINLNLLCGIHDCAEEVRKHTELLTSDEIRALTDALLSVSEDELGL